MLKKTNAVSKSNLLTEMRTHSMTIQELRFLSIYISKINPNDINSRYVEFTLDEFQRIMGLGRVNKSHIQDVFSRLLCKVVKIPMDTGRRRGFSMVTLFSKCQCFWDDDIDETRIIIDAHDDILPLLFDLKKNYLKYQLWNCLRLKSTNQIRMYEILKQYETLKMRRLSIDELKEMLGLTKDEYKVWERFKTRVLDSCQQALEKNTDIRFTYTPIKKGRKFVSIEFQIFKNDKFEDQLSLEEFVDSQPSVDFDGSPSEGDDLVNLLSEALCPDGSLTPEFDEKEVRYLTELVRTIPENKLPPLSSSDATVELRLYHYLAIRYAELNRRDIPSKKSKIDFHIFAK